MRVTRQRKTTTTLSLVVRGGSLVVTYRAFPPLAIRTSQSRDTDGGWASRTAWETKEDKHLPPAAVDYKFSSWPRVEEPLIEYSGYMSSELCKIKLHYIDHCREWLVENCRYWNVAQLKTNKQTNKNTLISSSVVYLSVLISYLN